MKLPFAVCLKTIDVAQRAPLPWPKAHANIGVTRMEAVDVVIMKRRPAGHSETMRLSGFSHAIRWQNIVRALGIKAVLLVLAIAGSATMWIAAFDDVGAGLRVETMDFDFCVAEGILGKGPPGGIMWFIRCATADKIVPFETERCPTLTLCTDYP